MVGRRQAKGMQLSNYNAIIVIWPKFMYLWYYLQFLLFTMNFLKQKLEKKSTRNMYV